MYRNMLVHAVLWPVGPKAAISLIDTDGVELANFPIDRPMLGSELARYLPAEHSVSFQQVQVVSLNGQLVVQTRVPFDTVVVTEKPVITTEERLERLERREQRRQRRFERDQEELRKLREQEAKRQGPELVEEPEAPAPAPAQEAEPFKAKPKAKANVPEPAAQGADDES